MNHHLDVVVYLTTVTKVDFMKLDRFRYHILNYTFLSENALISEWMLSLFQASENFNSNTIEDLLKWITNIEGVNLLVERGANLVSNLHSMLDFEEIKKLEMNFSKAFQLEFKDEKGMRILYKEAINNRNFEAVKMCVNSGNVNNQDYRGRTLLFLASQSGDFRLVQWLLEKGAKQNIADKEGLFPFHQAIEFNHTETIIILAQNAEIMHTYAKCGDYVSFQKFIELGVATNIKDKPGKLPLHYANEYNHKKIIKLLLNQNNVNDTIDSKGKTLLHTTVQLGDFEFVQWLLENGAKLDIEDSNGYLPIYYALENGHEEITELLNAFALSLNP